jgi:hypothetical protein
MLFFAWRGLAVGVHTSFSFVLVVLGIAILLFGTGTQGMGRFSSADATGRYTVGIAGGAGILAIAIGYGMVERGEKIQQVFEIQRHYAWVMFESNQDCALSIDNYWAEFTSDGEQLAYKRQNGEIFVLFPYSYNEILRAKETAKVTGKDVVKSIDAKLMVKDPSTLAVDPKRPCAKNPNPHLAIPMSQLSEQSESGFDFEKFPTAPVELVDPDAAVARLQANEAYQTQKTHQDAKPLNAQDVPPPLPVVQ